MIEGQMLNESEPDYDAGRAAMFIEQR